jgi:predicted amidohydrolase
MQAPSATRSYGSDEPAQFNLPQASQLLLPTRILRPGDISTHVFRVPAPLLTAEGKPAPYVLEARKRGIKFDVGHGGGSFSFALAEPMVKNGFFPDSISTDLHVDSATGGDAQSAQRDE